MKELIWFADLIVGLACFIIGGWNLMPVIHKIVIPGTPEPEPKRIPAPESIFIFLAGLLLLFAAYYGR